MDESMATSAVSGWAALVALASMGLGWWWVWRQVSTFAHRKQLSKSTQLLICFLSAGVGMFGAFCVAGALMFPDTNNSAVTMVIFGALLLSPSWWLWRRNSKSPPATDGATNTTTKIPTALSVVTSDPLPTQLPVVDVRGITLSGTAPDTSRYDESIAPIRPDQFHLVSSGSVNRVSDSSMLEENPEQDLDLSAAYAFTYQRNDGVVSKRRVQIIQGMFTSGAKYLGGVCLDANEWRTFRLDRIKGRITNEDTGELLTPGNLYASLADAGKTGKAVFQEASSTSPAARTKEWKTAVFFAGFRGRKLDELESMAMDAGWQVRSSITHTVDYVVRNGSAGQKQMTNAEKMGITVIDEDMFRALV